MDVPVYTSVLSVVDEARVFIRLAGPFDRFVFYNRLFQKIFGLSSLEFPFGWLERLHRA